MTTLETQKITITTAPVRDLTQDEVEACQELTDPRGSMYGYIMAAHEISCRYSYVVRSFVDGNLVGWALVYFWDGDENAEVMSGFFVDKRYRRRGIGSKLMAEVLSRTNRPLCCVHDRRSRGFFSNWKEQIEAYGI